MATIHPKILKSPNEQDHDNIQFKGLMENPSSEFARPFDVTQDENLSYWQKKSILESWEKTTRLLQERESTKSSPPDGLEKDVANRLDEILAAKKVLDQNTS